MQHRSLWDHKGGREGVGVINASVDVAATAQPRPNSHVLNHEPQLLIPRTGRRKFYTQWTGTAVNFNCHVFQVVRSIWCPSISDKMRALSLLRAGDTS